MTNIHHHSGSSFVNIQLQQVAGAVILEVKDNGKGIPPQVLESLKQASANMGVGLAGMRERVNELGGWLDVQSNTGGTTIKVSIPVATDSRRFAATVDPDSNISLASD